MMFSEDKLAVNYNPEKDAVPNDALIQEKYKTCWGIAVEQYSANVHAFAQLLYKSLYEPSYFNSDEAKQLYGGHPVFPDRLDALGLAIEAPKIVPEENVFIDEVRRTVTKEHDVKGCLYPESIQQLMKMMMDGQVIIWTAGDTYGIDGHPGSSSQLKKIVLAGINDLRHDAYRENVLIQSNDQMLQHPSDLLTVISSEDKHSEEIIEYVQELTLNHTVFVIDDRLKNIVDLQKRVPEIIPIWAQQDKHGKKIPLDLIEIDMAILQNTYNAIDGIDQVGSKIDELSKEHQKQPVFLVDFDGTLTNDTKRAMLQKQAVLDKLYSLGWM